MKRLTLVVSLMAFAALLASGCGSTQVKAEYQKYKKLHVGWLDLGEQNWKKYGYPKQSEWIEEIKVQNANLQKSVAGYFKGWTVTGASSKKAAAPRDAETLLVKFSNASLNESTYTVKCGIDYVDAAGGKVVKRAAVVTHEFSYSPWWGFSARVYNTMNALAGDVLVNLQK